MSVAARISSMTVMEASIIGALSWSVKLDAKPAVRTKAQPAFLWEKSLERTPTIGLCQPFHSCRDSSSRLLFEAPLGTSTLFCAAKATFAECAKAALCKVRREGAGRFLPSSRRALFICAICAASSSSLLPARSTRSLFYLFQYQK